MRKLFSIIACIIIFIIFYKIIDWKEVFLNLKTANLILLNFAIMLSLLWPILGFFRWKYILKKFGHTPSNKLILNSILISYSANLMIPGKGGDFSKVITTSKKKKSKFIFPVIVERTGDILVLIIMSIIGSIYLGEKKIIILTLSILFLFFTIILTFSILLKLIDLKSEKLNFVKNIFKEFLNFKTFFRNINYLFFALFFSFLNWVLASLQIWMFFKSYNAEIDLTNIVMLFPITILLSLIPVTPGGIGIRETFFLMLFSRYASNETCLIVSLNYYLFSVVMLGLIGLLFFYKFVNKK